ncbi:histone-lysine N-methyltransferase SETMAR [Trichonephila clavipes]|nr:histone-lysine N-methyltransferase SETMAR [Trichonephila clavipes]
MLVKSVELIPPDGMVWSFGEGSASSDDNARPHLAMAMQNHIATLGWEHLHHPPYSPDLAPRDFHLFSALKKNVTGRRFGSNA